MKLLFLTVMPSPYQRQLFRAIDALPDIDLSVLYFTAGAHDREWKRPDLYPFEQVLPGRTLTWLGPSAHWNPAVMDRIATIDPDLVVVSDYSALTAQLAMRRLRRRRTPFLFWGEVPGFSNRGRVGRSIRAILQAPLDHAAGIVGIGSVAADAYRHLVPGKPVFNIPYFCDLAPYRAARQTAGANRTSVDILFSGQLIARKGLDVLIRAFNEIAPAHPAARLRVLGAGPGRQMYESMVAEAVRDRVIFMGHQDPADLPAIFATADIFCLPSRHDGWGVVVNEALGAGLPIVASSATGAAHDLVTEGTNGFITPTDDVAALTDALRRLVADDRLRHRMAQASLDAAGRWGVEEGARRWQDVATRTLSA